MNARADAHMQGDLNCLRYGHPSKVSLPLDAVVYRGKKNVEQ